MKKSPGDVSVPSGLLFVARARRCALKERLVASRELRELLLSCVRIPPFVDFSGPIRVSDEPNRLWSTGPLSCGIRKNWDRRVYRIPDEDREVAYGSSVTPPERRLWDTSWRE